MVTPPLQPVVVHRGSRRNFEVAQYAAIRELTIVAYVDHAECEGDDATDGVPVVSWAAWRESFSEIPSIVSALDTATRRAIVARIIAGGGTFVTAVSARPGAISRSAVFGEGTVFGDGALYVGSSTTIGRHVIIMTPASVAHDITIGDFVTIHPSAAISGHVVIEDDVVIGVGAIIVNGTATKPLRVGCGSRIDAGAVVTKSIRAGATVAGNPARTIDSSMHTYNR